MKRPFRGSEEEVWVKGDQLANNLTFIISRNNSELWWEQPPEWGQNYWREQIVALPHHTTWKQKRGEWCREGKSVKKCDFCNMHGLGVFFKKSQGFWKPIRLFSPLPYCPGSLPYLLGVLAGSWVFQKRTNIPGDKWPHSRREVASLSGKWTHLAAWKPVWFSKQQCLCFQITLSEHPLEIVIFLSFLPAMGFHISEINYKLQSSDFQSSTECAG